MFILILSIVLNFGFARRVSQEEWEKRGSGIEYCKKGEKFDPVLCKEERRLRGYQDKKPTGEWIILPQEDFDRLRAKGELTPSDIRDYGVPGVVSEKWGLIQNPIIQCSKGLGIGIYDVAKDMVVGTASLIGDFGYILVIDTLTLFGNDEAERQILEKGEEQINSLEGVAYLLANGDLVWDMLYSYFQKEFSGKSQHEISEVTCYAVATLGADGLISILTAGSVTAATKFGKLSKLLKFLEREPSILSQLGKKRLTRTDFLELGQKFDKVRLKETDLPNVIPALQSADSTLPEMVTKRDEVFAKMTEILSYEARNPNMSKEAREYLRLAKQALDREHRELVRVVSATKFSEIALLPEGTSVEILAKERELRRLQTTAIEIGGFDPDQSLKITRDIERLTARRTKIMADTEALRAQIRQMPETGKISIQRKIDAILALQKETGAVDLAELNRLKYLLHHNQTAAAATRLAESNLAILRKLEETKEGKAVLRLLTVTDEFKDPSGNIDLNKMVYLYRQEKRLTPTELRAHRGYAIYQPNETQFTAIDDIYDTGLQLSGEIRQGGFRFISDPNNIDVLPNTYSDVLVEMRLGDLLEKGGKIYPTGNEGLYYMSVSKEPIPFRVVSELI